LITFKGRCASGIRLASERRVTFEYYGIGSTAGNSTRQYIARQVGHLAASGGSITATKEAVAATPRPGTRVRGKHEEASATTLLLPKPRPAVDDRDGS
jgi:hypothetical protein